VIVATFKTLSGTALIVLGLVVLVDAVRKFRWAVQSLRWPTVDAEVLGTQVVKQRGWRGSFYAPLVQYRYVREGVVREGNRLDFGDVWGSLLKRSAERRMKRYSRGEPVLARVHPTDPGLSVLQPGTSEGVFLAFGAPAISITFGVVWLLDGFSWWLR
jgi:uncharacterized protein DUF3592